MCTLYPRDEAIPDANSLLSIEAIPFKTCGEAEQAAALYLSQGSDARNIFSVRELSSDPLRFDVVNLQGEEDVEEYPQHLSDGPPGPAGGSSLRFDVADMVDDSDSSQ